MKTPKRSTKWFNVPCPCGRGTIPGYLYEAGQRTCGNEPTCETCGAAATTTRTEGGSTPTYALCAECASTFDLVTASDSEDAYQAALVAERHAAYHPKEDAK